NSPQSPYKTLNEALSSVESFEKHYLDLSHTAIEMYQTIGQVRSSQLLGKDLADFYMRKGEPQKAEMYLQEALKTYQAEGWPLLIAHTRKQLAECQKQLQQTQNYLQTSSLLAGDDNLTETERIHFCQEILNLTQQPDSGQDDRLLLGMEGFLQLQSLCFKPVCAMVHVGGLLEIELTVHSLMPLPVHLHQLSIHLNLSVSKDTSKRGSELGSRSRNVNGIFLFPSGPIGHPSPRNKQPFIELCELYEQSPSDSSLNSSGIICKNMHLLFGRQESSSSLERSSGLAVEDAAHVLRTTDILLKPGINTIHFKTEASAFKTQNTKNNGSSL
ncbi:hypothetical protein scyTo_0022165, partial [Scyliorhinus torazame]|nr:hypothetical protein [Scyliorhinus torazame]